MGKKGRSHTKVLSDTAVDLASQISTTKRTKSTSRVRILRTEQRCWQLKVHPQQAQVTKKVWRPKSEIVDSQIVETILPTQIQEFTTPEENQRQPTEIIKQKAKHLQRLLWGQVKQDDIATIEHKARQLQQMLWGKITQGSAGHLASECQ